MMNVRLTAVMFAVLCLGMGTLTFADSTPQSSGSPASAPPAIPGIPPSVTKNPYVQSVLQAIGGLFQTTNGNAAHGKVTYFKQFELQIETAPHVYREIHLHQGTEIDPRGTTLNRGMLVNVNGAAQSDGSLNADVITVSP